MLSDKLKKAQKQLFIKWLQMYGAIDLVYDADFNIISGRLYIYNIELVPGDYSNIIINSDVIIKKGVDLSNAICTAQVTYNGEGQLPKEIKWLTIGNITTDLTAEAKYRIHLFSQHRVIDQTGTIDSDKDYLNKNKINLKSNLIEIDGLTVTDLSGFDCNDLRFNGCKLPKDLTSLKDNVKKVTIEYCTGLEDLKGGEKLNYIKVHKSGSITVPNNLTAKTINVKDKKNRVDKIDSSDLHVLKNKILNAANIELGQEYGADELTDNNINYIPAKKNKHKIDKVNINWTSGEGGNVILKSDKKLIGKLELKENMKHLKRMNESIESLTSRIENIIHDNIELRDVPYSESGDVEVDYRTIKTSAHEIIELLKKEGYIKEEPKKQEIKFTSLSADKREQMMMDALRMREEEWMKKYPVGDHGDYLNRAKSRWKLD